MAAATYFDQVQKIYIAFYQRPADAAGLKYWAGEVDKAGGSLAAVINAFAGEKEAQDLYGPINATTIGTVIDKLYLALFGRAPDTAGKDFYIDAFTKGTFSAGAIALAVLEGAQSSDLPRINNKVAVANEFTAQVDGRALTDANFGTAPFNVTYSGEPDAIAARGILNKVTADASTVLTPAQVTDALKTQIADVTDPIVAGSTFMLTTGLTDNLVGTTAAEIFTGATSALSAENTLNATDKIDGDAGTDVAKISLGADFAGFTKDSGYLKNVETIELTNSTAAARAFDATGVTGATKYVLNAATGAINLANLEAAGVTVDVVGQKSGTATVGFTTKAVEGTADALTVGVNGVGTAAVKDAAGTVTTAAAYLGVTAAGIEALTVNATGANLVNLASAGTKTIAVTGAGSLTVEAINAGVTSFDASALTGAVTADLTAATAGALATVKGGAGDDVFTVDLADLAGNATINGGAGANILKASGTGTIQPTMAKIQTVELNDVTAGGVIISGKNVTDLANLNIKGKGIGAETVTVANLTAAALNVNVEGAQVAAGTVQLASPTVLTYSTKADAATTTAKGQNEVAIAVSATEASKATINVGAYTKQTGAITLNKATDVTLNVASGKNGTTEQTVFNGTLTANAAQTVTVKADGALTAAAISAAVATKVDVKAAAGGALKLDAVKAQQITIDTGADFALTSTAGLSAVSTLNLSGTGALSAISGAVVIGSATVTTPVTVNASGLKGGVTLGTIDTKGGNVTLNATEVTGKFVTGDIGSGTNKVGNVTINAATLGSTEVGAINTVAGASVQVNATSLLGKNGAAESIKVGNVTVVSEGSKNTGSISVTVDGANKFTIGTLTANTVSVDASNFLGADINGGFATLGNITGQNVTVKGSNLGANTITIDAMQNVAETGAVINVTGGILNDELVIDTTADILVDDAVTITFTGATQAAAGKDVIKFADNANLTHASSKLTLSGVEELNVASAKAVVVKAADLSGAEFTLTAGATTSSLTLKGTDAADTIDASKITSSTTAANFAINGGKAADTIKLTAATSDAATVQVNVTSNTTGSVYSTESSTTAYDKVTSFALGKDKVAILDTDGTAETFAVSTAATVNTLNIVTASITTGVVTGFVVGTGAGTTALTAGEARIDTLAEIVSILDAQVATLGDSVSFVFGGNQYIFAQNGSADVLVELTGVTTGAVLTATGSVFNLA